MHTNPSCECRLGTGLASRTRWNLFRFIMPGRPQRRVQKRKQAALTCYHLDQVITPKKSARSPQCDTVASPHESSDSNCCDAPGRAPSLSSEIPFTSKESSSLEVTTCFSAADLRRLYQMSSSFYTIINSLSPSENIIS